MQVAGESDGRTLRKTINFAAKLGVLPQRAAALDTILARLLDLVPEHEPRDSFHVIKVLRASWPLRNTLLR